MTWIRASAVFVAASVLAAPSPESFLNHRWYQVEIVVFAYDSSESKEKETLLEPASALENFPYEMILVRGAVNEFDWLHLETAWDARHPPWTREKTNPKPPVSESAIDNAAETEPAWLGNWRWSEPFTETDLGAITGFGFPQARFLYERLDANAALRGATQSTSAIVEQPTAREILDSIGAAFASYETDLIADVHRWTEGGEFLAKAVKRLPKYGARVIVHGFFTQAIWPIEKSPPLLLQFGERLSNGMFEIEGTMNLAQDRQLQLHMRLVLSRELPGQAKSMQPSRNSSSFNHSEIRELRRALGGQTHYFDHPDFGVLVYLQPLEVSKELLELLPQIDEAVTGEFFE